LSERNSLDNIYEVDGTPKYEKVVFGIQDYKPLWSGVLQRNWEKTQAYNFLIVSYINNIVAYHAFPNDKILLRYEDILENHFSEGQRLLDFLGITAEKIPQIGGMNFSKDGLDSVFRSKIEEIYRNRLGTLYEYVKKYEEGVADYAKN